jgi:hypothetical protein
MQLRNPACKRQANPEASSCPFQRFSASREHVEDALDHFGLDAAAVIANP